MRLGLDNVKALKVGNVNASRAYLGNLLVWEGGDTPPPAEWTLYDDGTPLIGANTFGFASIVYLSGTYYAYVHGSDNKIDRYTSSDGITWTHTGEVLAASEAWEGGMLGVPQVWVESGTWHMLYRGRVSGYLDRTGYATSSDGITWTKHPGNPVLSWGAPGTWDAEGAEATSPIKVGSTYYVYYEGGTGMGRQLGIATSTDLITWTKDLHNPIFSDGVFCPFVWVHSGVYYMLLPRYTNVVNSPSRGVLDLYRSPRPTFYPAEREYLGAIYDSEENSPLLTVPDTPWIVQADITNRNKIQPGLKVYFSTGTSGHDGLYLLEHGDAEAALDLLTGVAIMHVGGLDWLEGTLTQATTLGPGIVLDTTETTIVNQTVETATGSNIGTSIDQAVGNSFTTTDPMYGVFVEAKVDVTGTPTSRLKCRIYRASSGLPAGDPLAVGFTTHSTSGWARFEFPNLELKGGTQYIYVIGPEFAEASNMYAMRGDGGANSYPGGTYVFYRTPISPSWQLNATWDCTFRVNTMTASGGTGAGTFESDDLDLSPAGVASGATRIRWDAATDEDTSVQLETAVSTDGGATYSSYQAVTNGGTIPSIPASQNLSNYRLKYRASLASSDLAKSPNLRQVLLEVQSQ